MKLSTLRRRPLMLGWVTTVIALVAAIGAAFAFSAITDDKPKVDATLHLTAPDQDPQPQVEGNKVGTPAPTASFAKLTGGLTSLAAYKGRPVVLNFFASWCVPCRKEMPDLQKVHTELGAKVAFLGLAVRDPTKDASDLVKSTGVTYDIARDPAGKLFSELGVINMPTTFFVSASGRIVGAHPGALTAADLRKLVNQYFHVS